VQLGAAWAPLRNGYRRRDPEATVLHQAVRENLATFLAEAAEHGGLPRHVERELFDDLDCGVLSRGPGMVLPSHSSGNLSHPARLPSPHGRRHTGSLTTRTRLPLLYEDVHAPHAPWRVAWRGMGYRSHMGKASVQATLPGSRP